MDTRGIRAVALARAQGFLVFLVPDFALVRVHGCLLEVGPLASPDVIATLACRAELSRAGVHDELAVVEAVQASGYDYSPEPWRRGEA